MQVPPTLRFVMDREMPNFACKGFDSASTLKIVILFTCRKCGDCIFI